ACRKAVMCPEAEVAGAARWRPVMTARFTVGPHAFTVSLARDAVIERVRVERRKDTAEDYVATLRRLGLDPGAPGPGSRRTAVDAMEFIHGKRGLQISSNPFCGDIEMKSGVVVAGAGAPGSTPGGPGGSGGGSGGNGGTPSGPGSTPGDPQSPLSPPVVPPQHVASPVQVGN